MKRAFVWAVIASFSTLVCSAAIPGANVCPQPASNGANGTYESQVATQGTCNEVITVAANGTVSTAIANTAPYDGTDDQIVGVVNNSSGTITSITLTGSAAIFAFDGDGICSFQPFLSNSQPCNAPDATDNYLGGASTVSGVNAAQTSGTLGWSPGIGPGTTSYFSLEQPASLTTVVTIVLPPNFTKSFTPSTVSTGGATTLSFTLTNPNSGTSLTGVGFTDSLPAGVVVNTPNGLAGTCGGGTITATAGSSSISLSGATLAGGGNCTFSVSVIGQTVGTKNNSATATSSAGNSPPATATLNVVIPLIPPTISKAFGVLALLPNGTTSVTFVITNPNSAAALTSLAFSDALPGGLVVSTPSGASNTCGGTFTATAGATSVNLTGGSLVAGGSCSISFNVTAPSTEVGLLTNTTSTLTSANAGPGGPATATIFIGNPYQISYASNLPSGDSYVNITNSGAQGGVTLGSGTSASLGGSLCVNVYVFSPDEQLSACCSCPITPDGLGSLSAQKDLINNPLTRATPTSIVIKLLATVPVGGTCANSAAGIGSETLAAGLTAWSSTLHTRSPTGEGQNGAFALTEVPFTPSDLSATELGRLGYACTAIANQGSTFGVCNSCRLGGLGATSSVQ